ncbi:MULTISPECIES: hypothetical protein [Nocardia]|uniref:hypothetical protein n=1 Tax=Nocardia TaxID=1817 RepID=UPI000D68DAB8|nr:MULTISPECIES: hypothetical protein [Nocardia]
MSVGERTRVRVPFWFVWWMVLVIGVVLVLCLVSVWVIATEGTQTSKVVLSALLAVAAGIAALSALVGLFRYRAIVLSLTAPLLIGLLAAAVWYEIPQKGAWQLSHGILEDQAVDCVNPGERTRLGVYSIRYIDRRDGGCLFYFEGDEKNSEGFGYFPDSPPPYIGPPAERGIGYEPYRIPWYRFVDNS